MSEWGCWVSLSVCLSICLSVCLSMSNSALHSLFGFCQRSLTVTLVDSYCSAAPLLSPARSQLLCGGRTNGGRTGEMGQPRLQQDPFSSFRPTQRVCRAMSVAVGCPLPPPRAVRPSASARPSSFSSCLMTTLARIGFPSSCFSARPPA